MDTIRPIQKNYNNILKDEDFLDNIAKEGASKVSTIAQKVMKRVKNKIGI